MWHLMKKGKGLLLFCFFAKTGFSQSMQNPSPLHERSSSSETSLYQTAMTQHARRESSSWSFSPKIGLGYGKFQNIVIPQDDASPELGERSRAGTGVTEQAGVPLILGVGLTYPETLVRTATDFSFLRMTTMAPNSSGQKSTPGFSRMELGQTVMLDFQDDLWNIFGAASYRRDSFKDGSFAHVIDAVMLKAGAEIRLFNNAISANYGRSATASFAFTDRSSFHVSRVPGSTASVQLVGASFRRALGRSTEFNFSFERETIGLTYPVRGAYQSFGLAGDADVSTRSLTLTTDLTSLSLIKHF